MLVCWSFVILPDHLDDAVLAGTKRAGGLVLNETSAYSGISEPRTVSREKKGARDTPLVIAMVTHEHPI